MYFITKRDSDTGKKFEEVVRKRKLYFDAQIALADEYGYEKWRYGHFSAFGGISACIFINPPDEKVWKKIKNPNEFMPRRNIKEGKEILKRFEELPSIKYQELNMCIGWDEDWNCIGFAFPVTTILGLRLMMIGTLKCQKTARKSLSQSISRYSLIKSLRTKITQSLFLKSIQKLN